MSHIFGPDDFALGKKGPIKREFFSPLPLKVRNFGKIGELINMFGDKLNITLTIQSKSTLFTLFKTFNIS